MPHISVPAAELNTRLDRLRCAMTEKDPAWSMLLLDNTLDMYYFTGTMQDGALVVTPDQATLFVRRSFDVGKGRIRLCRHPVRWAVSAASRRSIRIFRRPSTLPQRP